MKPTIDHRCGVKRCVRPSHLEAVEHRENRIRSHLRHIAGGFLPLAGDLREHPSYGLAVIRERCCGKHAEYARERDKRAARAPQRLLPDLT